MNITRRGWFGVAAAGATALATPALAQAGRPTSGRFDVPAAAFQILSPGKRDYRPALEALAAYARDELETVGLPGMTLSVTDNEGFTAVIALGWANLDRREPITPQHLFQIGSISKSFLALTVLSLADAGKVDLDAQIAQYLPGPPWPDSPMTVAQVLSHTAGLPDDCPIFPRTPDGRLWTGFPAGSRFSYSNTGYNLLGAMVEHLTGLSHEAAILKHVRTPLGVADIAGQIDQDNRSRCPIAYEPWDQAQSDELPGGLLGQATWDPEDMPAGCIAATSEMMARYLRGMMAIALGKGPILSPKSGRRFATGVTASDSDFGPGSQYAMGISIQPVDGVPCLHHTGGMVAFSSSFHADPAAGVASFASVNARNGPYRPRLTTAYAIRLMRAVREGKPLPAPPDPLTPWRIKDPTPLLGRWVMPDGTAFTISAGGDQPTVTVGNEAADLFRRSGGAATSHPALSRHALQTAPGGALWWGETLLGRDAPAPQPAVPDNLRMLTGVYVNRDPWLGTAVVMARGDQIAAEGVGALADRGNYWSLEKDVGGLERFRFDGVIGGKTTRLNFSGRDFIRLGG